MSEAAYEALRWVSEGQGKPLSEWCRNPIMEATASPGPRPADFAVIAEVAATQAILIDLLCAMGRDGRFSTQKAQEIVDKAHDQKYKEANELLRLGYAKPPKYCIVIPPLGEGRTG